MEVNHPKGAYWINHSNPFIGQSRWLTYLLTTDFVVQCAFGLVWNSIVTMMRNSGWGYAHLLMTYDK